MTHLHSAVAGRHGIHAVPPELAHIENIRLVHRAEPAPPLLGDLKGHLGNPIHLRSGVGHGVETALVCLGLDASLGLTEVDPAGEFTHNHQVHPLDHLRFEAAGIDEGRNNLHRPEIGEQLHAGAQPKQAGFWPFLAGKAVEAGAADGGQQHSIGCLAGFQGAVGQRLTGGIDGTAADGLFLKAQRKTMTLAHHLQQLAGDSGDLGADAITGQENNAVLSHDGPVRQVDR